MQSHCEQLEHLSTVLDSVADGVFTVDAEMRITSFNRAAEEITGFRQEEALGKHCYEIFRTGVCFSLCPLR
ncbi:MAG: PAS domain S-box protein, partial [Desulfuromonadales bacterium]|nr:PAS domain S-box protein [Desulfuromonadales bacterium]NIS39730.1 PAS domain S-box protein [Desulfuromonadales bacterium]